MAQPQRGVRLKQVYAFDTENDASIDIIAIHGLDTKSPDTWLWKSEHPNEPGVNWLADHDMLPSRVGPARIFTCDWPANMCRPSDSDPMELGECSRLLLAGIESRNSPASGQAPKQDRPIVFIASCLGGIILMQALVMASPDYLSIRKATRGIVFLATPFRGTSFQDIASWAEPGLKLWALVRGQQVTTLLDNLKGPTFDLDELVRGFTQLCLDCSYQAQTFYESRDTRLHTKIPLANWSPPWLLDRSIPPKQLVDKTSASLDIVRHPLRLDRPHVTMNKFSHPDDSDYRIVAGRIEGMLRNIRDGSPLAIADAFIRAKHYTPDRLQIIRLSGQPLEMDQCYINLSMLEQSDMRSHESKSPSKLSLFARLSAETPSKKAQVDLENIFSPRQVSGGKTMEPRRILIRGRAGVGKTTLCKKIVHDFTYEGTWGELFDRLLWVPLRNLKSKSLAKYNLGDLFHSEYFSQRPNGRSLAEAMWKTLDDANFEKTLFILDGLDEVSEGLGESHDMNPLLTFLLNLPNVIITSRPYVKLPGSLSALHLQVETVGFYPDQVDEYLKTTIRNQTQINDIQSFLQGHWLIQGLVRIPIQLDALCYTWEDSDFGEDLPQTMTAIYVAIERKLWKKDIARLRIRTSDEIQDARSDSEITPLITPERDLLETLAFSGLVNDTMNFDRKYRDRIYANSGRPSTKFSWDDTLARLSFLRTSDASSGNRNRSYHFLHLTFQEYFAARYFVRKWKTGERLECENTEPVGFLRKHKYTGHYDVFWRFVAGLFEAEGKASTFFEMIESEPRDLLGPTHQRLVMHCLSEVSSEIPMRSQLEEDMIELLFLEIHCKAKRHYYPPISTLANEMEFPERALITALRQGSIDAKVAIFGSLRNRPRVSPIILELAVAYLKYDRNWPEDTISPFLALQSALPNDILKAITALCECESFEDKTAVVRALCGQSNLPNETLKALVALLGDENKWVTETVVDEVLGAQASLPDDILETLKSRLEDKNVDVRWLATKILARQSFVSKYARRALIEQLEHDDLSIRSTTIDALSHISELPNDILEALKAQLKHEDADIRSAAIETLGHQSSLPNDILEATKAQLADKDVKVRCAAIGSLWRQKSAITNEMTKVIVALLNSKDPNVRRATVDTLLKLKLEGLELFPLPNKILEALVARLGDKNVGWNALLILTSQRTLSNEILDAIVTRLSYDDANIRENATLALGNRLTLSDEISDAVMARLKDNDASVRAKAVRVLGESGRLTLSDADGILTLIASLNDDDAEVRAETVRALGALTPPSDILNAVTALLTDTHEGVIRGTCVALANQPDLPNETLKAVTALLGYSNNIDALGVLSCQSTLPEWALQAVAPILNSLDAEERDAAEAILRRYGNFYSTLLNGTYAAALYTILLHNSFDTQLSLYIEDSCCCVNTPEGFIRAPINNLTEFMNTIWAEKARPRAAPRNTYMIKDAPPIRESGSQVSSEDASQPCSERDSISPRESVPQPCSENGSRVSSDLSFRSFTEYSQHGEGGGCLGVLHTTLRRVYLRLLGIEERTTGPITEPLISAGR